MTIYDFIKTHTIDEITEEVTKNLDAGTDLQTFFEVNNIVNVKACEDHMCSHLTIRDECACICVEHFCPCLEDQKKFIKEEIKDILNTDIEGDLK